MRRLALIALSLLALSSPPAATAATSFTAGPQGLDARFGSCGVLTPNAGLRFGGAARRLARTTDGSVIVAGSGSSAAAGSPANDSFVLARLSPAGQLDAGFGSGGSVVTSFPVSKDSGDVTLTGLGVQPDGKIVVGGHMKVDEFNSAHHFVSLLARYDASGKLDPSFGTGGIVRDALPATRGGRIEALAIAPDGGIVAAGVRNDATDQADPSYQEDRFTVARYRADGTPDPAFGSGGFATVDPGFGGSSANAVEIDAAGRIVAGGQAGEQFALARLTPAGTLDPTFGDGGATYASPPAAASISALTLLPGGGVVATGSASNINGRFQVALGRYNADGSPDPGFGRSGFVIDRLGSLPTAVAAAADGTLTVVGSSQAPFPSGYGGGGLIRYGAAGAREGGFGVSGAVVGFSSYGIDPGDLLLEPDGTVLVAEDYGTDFAIVRFAADEPALGATVGQPQACSVHIASKSIHQLIHPGRGVPRGKLLLSFSLRRPGGVRLSATAKVGARLASVGRTTVHSFTFGKGVATIKVSKSAYRLLRRARRADIVVTARGTDGNGAATTGTRRLGR